MRIVDALIEVLKEKESLTCIEAYKMIKERNLYQFGAKNPEALEPPPTQATRESIWILRSAHCFFTSSPIIDWKVRTMSGKGAGPKAEPRQ